MRVLGCRRQRAVDGRGKRMHEFGPGRIEQPQAAAAALAEMSLGTAGMAGFALFAHDRVIDADVVLAADPQGTCIAADVDGVAASALRLAADRAVAALVGDGRGAFEREMHGAAMTGSFESHDGLRL